MDGHNALSVLGLPFHLMITFSGLVLFMGMLMPAGILAVYDDARQFSDEVFASFKVTRRSPAPLTELAPLVAQAESHWQGSVGRITVNNPGDAGATVTLTRNAADGVSYGRLSPYMRFDGVTGQMQESLDELSPTVRTAGVITGLHLGLFAAPLLRWFYFLVSLAGTGMVGTGLVLWIAKRRQKARPGAREAFSLRLVDGERRHGGRPVHRRRRLLLGQSPAAGRPAGPAALGSARLLLGLGPVAGLRLPVPAP